MEKVWPVIIPINSSPVVSMHEQPIVGHLLVSPLAWPRSFKLSSSVAMALALCLHIRFKYVNDEIVRG